MEVWGFAEDDIMVLMDDGYHINPTRSNILKAYARLAAASQSGDAVFCHYSGKFTDEMRIIIRWKTSIEAKVDDAKQKCEYIILLHQDTEDMFVMMIGAKK